VSAGGFVRFNQTEYENFGLSPVFSNPGEERDDLLDLLVIYNFIIVDCLVPGWPGLFCAFLEVHTNGSVTTR